MRLLITFLIYATTIGTTTGQHSHPSFFVDGAKVEYEATSLLKLKVCLMVEPSPFTYVSGYANRFQAMILFLAQNNDTVEVITCDRQKKSKPVHWNGARVHHTYGVALPLYPNVTVSADWNFKCFRILRRLQPDLIHVTSPGLMVLPSILYANLLGVPLLMSYHTHLPVYLARYLFPWSDRIAWWWIKMTHSFADYTLVTSPQILDEFEQHQILRVDVWNKGVDTNRFHPDHADANIRDRMTSQRPNDFLLLYVGRLAVEKRVEDLKPILDAFPSGTCICFVGTGPQEATLRVLFADSRAVFMGELHGVELSQAFASADVFVFPSDSETLGFVVLEAMASGTPVVAAKAGGVPSLIDHGETSFLVETGNTTGFCYYINQLKNDKLRSAIGRRARSEAEKWSWESSMAHLRNQHYYRAIQNFANRKKS